MSGGELLGSYDRLQSQYEQAMEARDAQDDSAEGAMNTVMALKRIHHEYSQLRADGYEALEDQCSLCEETAIAVEEELLALEAQVKLMHAASVTPTTVGSCTADTLSDKKSFGAMATELAELHSQLVLSRTVLKAVLTKSAEEIRDEKIALADVRFADPSSWELRERGLIRSLESLRAKAATLKMSSCSIEGEERLLIEVQQLATAAADHIRKGEELRGLRDSQLPVFFSECDKLSLWCRQQLANLDAMQDPDHIQEYCATLVENYKVMSHNFSLLLEGVEEYVQANHVPVRTALMEADQVWLYLQVSAMERLSRTLFEIHPESLLEVEVETYAGYTDDLRTFLSHLMRLLEQPLPSDLVALSAERDKLRTSCAELQSTLDTDGGTLPVEMREFAIRRRAARSGYQCFRQAVLSRLTYLTSSADIVVESKRRQQEFHLCANELKDWARVAARGESWRDIYSKIAEIKQMIKQEQRHLQEHLDVATS